MVVFHITKTNIEDMYYYLRFNGATAHPYEDSSDKKLGLATLEDELIIKPGDYLVEKDTGYEKIDRNIVHKLIQYGQLTIKE